MTKSERSAIASQLGQMAKGVKKNMTPEAMQQRRDAAKASAKARKKNRRDLIKKRAGE